MIRLRKPIFLILIAFLLGLQVMDPSEVWTILLVGFVGTLVTAYVWAQSLGRDIELRRETRLRWVQVGGQIEERITLSNGFSLPAAQVEFVDQSTLPGFDASRSTSINAGYFDQWTLSATCKQRGLFYLGGAEISTGDPFGIFEVNLRDFKRTSILVLPQIAALPELPIAPSGSHGDGQPRRNASEKTIHAATVREYVHGDSMRMIHWNTTARMNKLFVRLMESTPEGDWWILLDLDKQYMLGAGWDSVEEQCVTLAASLADRGLRLRKSVGLIGNSRELIWLTPQKGEGQRWEIMQSLATASPSDLDLGSVLERILPSLGRQHSLIIVTASTKLDWIKTLLPMTKRNIRSIPTVMLLDLAPYGETSAEQSAVFLEERGVICHVIPQGIMDLPKMETVPAKGTWQTTPTGDLIPLPAGKVTG
ncbi:hypothetical protein ANAEL_00807 [Anaerolineales bacterium]|nr:hypothetical protein ANAEL_00807 [Anaerolineales bacterium]